MFQVKVVGQYVARSPVSDKEKIKKNYEITGMIPTAKAPLSVVKNKLLGPALAKAYPDYVTFLTYHIVELTPMDEASKAQMRHIDVQYMNREDLLAYIQAHNIGACVVDAGKDNERTYGTIDHSYYPSLFKLREAVQIAKEDPVGYWKHFELHEEDLRLDLEMAKLNPEVFQSETEGFIASVSLPAKSTVKAAKPAVHAKQAQDRTDAMAKEQIKDGDMAPLEDTPELDINDL